MMKKKRSNSPKRRRTSKNGPTWMIFGLFAVIIFGCCLTTTPAKEIEATNEWTLLGENDTVAAGMHVRMDLTTGEKWVKTIDDDDNESETNTNVHVVGDAVAAVVDVQGQVSVMEQTNNDNNDRNDEEAAEPNYDYEMMHRTLSKLPPEEQDRIGGIPKLETKLTPEQRAAFEARMKQIWEQRQADLKQFQEDHLADLPQLLKDRIASIKTYLENPLQGLQELQLASETQPNEEEEDMVGDIVAVLQDLEYHLTDVDMARDFYTLGGWPVLSSLLADAVHESTIGSNSTQQQSLSDDDWNKVNLIQAHAAWAIGTTVKNTGEFSPYAIDQVEVPQANQVVKTTTLDLVLAQFVASSTAVLEYDEQSTENNDSDYFDTVMMKVHKTLYAVGAMLRGNRQAQTHFCADQGPALLANVLTSVADQVDASGGNKNTLKIAQRLLSLAQDIVMDVTLHSSTSEQVDQAIGNAFSDAQWCQTTLRFLPIPRLYETSLLTIQQLAPQCTAEDLDEEIRKERMDLLQATVTAVQQAQKQ
ncbi:expressed unknown protein [Seminavis robusta]|uniref:Uncharacterized protein n=1 Tax=Seminavis robusta TaxID=568900 RepID=A0A9N8DAY4_9STRA|nr:expressed unknown protein [Seminavis robusta]|eukprot:Sro4_g003590.1 n/a (531) ;mRNA; r:196680-198353